MATKYAAVADRIIELVGGPANVSGVFHCQTRLRFTLKDESLARPAELMELDDVAQTLSAGGLFQVVVGTHVKDVFEEVARSLAASGIALGQDDAEPSGERPNVLNQVISFISGSFAPVVPALAGAGMLAALLSVLVAFGWVSNESVTYKVISFMANAVFYFLPIVIAFSAAAKLKINQYVAVGIAAMMLHPNWVAMVTEAEPISLFEIIPLHLVTYNATVIPIFLVLWVQSYLERWLEKVIPNQIKLVIIPMIVFFVMGIVALSALGPIGAIMGNYLAIVFTWLGENAPWAAPTIIGGLLPVMVMFGVHHAVAPVGFMQMAQFGFDSLFGPGALVSNMAQAAATSVVALRSKDPKTKQIATASAVTAFMGITEPALYGVNLPKRYPLIAAMVGGAAGGFYAGVTATKRFAVGSSGLPAIPMYIGDDTMRHFINISIAIVIAVVVTVIVAVALSLRFEKTAPQTHVDGVKGQPETTPSLLDATGSTSAPSGPVVELVAPVAGSVIALADVADAAFASGALGSGVGIEPDNGLIVAPCAGIVVAAATTGHAYGIRTDEGTEVLVHVGVDTVRMNGEGFAPIVGRGDRVAAGQVLAKVDLDAVREAGYSPTVILVVVNRGDVTDVITVAPGHTAAGARVAELIR